jgi:hypothetical protein
VVLHGYTENKSEFDIADIDDCGQMERIASNRMTRIVELQAHAPTDSSVLVHRKPL